MTGSELQEVARLAAQTAIAEVQFHLEDKPQYVTERTARRKYGHLLDEWVARGYVKPVHTENGKHDKFPLHELVRCYGIWRSSI